MILNKPEYLFLILKNLTMNMLIYGYALVALAIMPDHIHLLICLGNTTLSRFMHTFKLNSSKQINRLIKPDEPFHWQKSFRDWLIRSDENYRRLLEYTMTNPKHHQMDGFVWAAPLRYSSLEEARHDKLVSLVMDMFTLKSQLSECTLEDKELLRSHLMATDLKMDELVSDIYDLKHKRTKNKCAAEVGNLRCINYDLINSTQENRINERPGKNLCSSEERPPAHRPAGG
jgi:REP element-mobilizing transposase RayT